jgi:hypothetical protein
VDSVVSQKKSLKTGIQKKTKKNMTQALTFKLSQRAKCPYGKVTGPTMIYKKMNQILQIITKGKFIEKIKKQPWCTYAFKR